ncbi:MAG: DUF87 domain-containing protein [Pseudomonadota bacterium]
MKAIAVGKTGDSRLLRLDAEQLLETRLLIQGASGSGKSWIIRGLAEKLAKRIPTLILDLEGEFVTLREQVDLVVAGEGGDTGVDVRSAGLLARKLLELQLSAVVDLSDLTRPQRKNYVRQFLESVMQAPRTLWGPRLVVLDETHEFAPESGKSESLPAVIDLASRGRKRGFCLVAATQRLSKLHKDVAAELRNVMIGHTTLDVDVKRSLDTLGKPADLPHKREIRGLEHEFYAMGPAISEPGVSMFTAGEVRTTHPQSGMRRQLEPPQPSRAIQKVLGELADLPEKAQEEAKTLAEAQVRIKQLEREVKAKPKGESVEVSVVDQIAIDQAVELRDKHWRSELLKFEQANGKLAGRLEQIGKLAHANGEAKIKAEQPPEPPVNRNMHKRQQKRSSATQSPTSKALPSSLPKGEQKILCAIAMYSDGVDRGQLSILTGYKRSSRDAYVQRLREKGLINTDGPILATDAGFATLGDAFEPLPTGAELRDYWVANLPAGEAAVLDCLVGAYPHPLDREIIGEMTGYKRSSRDAYIQRLKTRKLASSNRDGVRASDGLFD